jgi:hypothetical protein
MYLRDDEADIRLTVTDKTGNPIAVGDGNSWATYAGAALTAAGSKTRPGGMGKQKAQGGPATRGDTTVTIQNSDTMIGLHPFLESRIGKGNCVVTVTYLDDEGNVIPGAQFRVTGKLKEAALPGQNYDSPNVAMYTVTVDSDEEAA